MSDINIQTFSGKVSVKNDLRVGQGHLFVDTAANQVGLNSLTPQANLHVTGNTYVTSDLRVGSKVLIDSSAADSNVLVITGGGIKADFILGDGRSQWTTTGNDVYYTGSVAIGSSQAPTTALDVTGSGTFSGDLTAAFLHGDGSNISNITSSQWTTVNTNELYYALGNVGIGNQNPNYTLDVTGDINFTGDLYQNGTIFGGGSVWQAGTGTKIYYSAGEVGIANTNPQHTLSVGSNLYVEDAGSNVLVVDGNVACTQLTLGQFEIVPSYGLGDVTAESNVTTDTVELNNATTGLSTVSNVVVGGELTVSGNAAVSSNLTVTGNAAVSSNLTVTGNATVSSNLTVSGNATVSSNLTVSGNVAVNGILEQNDKEIYAQRRWEIDLTSNLTTQFFPIEFKHLETTNLPIGDLPPVHFKIFGQLLLGTDNFNENTLVGYARASGWTDHEPMYDVHIKRYVGDETRFLGLYEGTGDYFDGFVIYMRGGYNYSVLTDADEVVTHTSAYTVGTQAASTFAIKDSSGTDVYGTSTAIKQLINIGGSTQHDQRWLSGDVSIGDGATIKNAKLAATGTNNTYGPIFQINDWKTLTWSGNNVTGNKDVTIITHNGVDSGNGVIGGIVEVICFRGGYAQQRAYARFHVNYSYWSSAWRGHFLALEKDMNAQTTDITIVDSNSPVKIDVRISSPSGTLGQYYIKFHGPIYNQN